MKVDAIDPTAGDRVWWSWIEDGKLLTLVLALRQRRPDLFI